MGITHGTGGGGGGAGVVGGIVEKVGSGVSKLQQYT